MSEVPDDDLDQLAAVPPEAFVAARDQLARRLRAEGRRDRADEVRALRRPTVPGWLAGEVARSRSAEVDALRAAVAAVAEAQELAITGGDRDRLRSATERRRAAVRVLGTAVDEVLATQGRPVRHRDEVLRDLEAAVLAELGPGPFGLREDLDVADPPGRRSPTAAAVAEPDPELVRRRAQAGEAVARAVGQVERLRAELARAEAELAGAEAELAGAEAELAGAEAGLAALDGPA